MGETSFWSLFNTNLILYIGKDIRTDTQGIFADKVILVV